MGPTGYSTPANDVWSLGIIFTSMISGHNPWRRAVMTDDCFRSYIRNPDFFRLMLPISAAANDILVDIFAPSEIRLTLCALRKRIVDADTFFLTDDQIATSSKFVQLAAASYLASNSAPNSAASSFEALLDLDTADTQGGKVTTGQEQAALLQDTKFDDVAPLQPSPAGLQVNGTSPELRKRPVPPPQPMPSFRDFRRLSSQSSSSETHSKSGKAWRTHSPTKLFRRLIGKALS